MAQAAPAAGTANNATGTSGRTRRQLPRTASPLPLFELLSGLSIAGGLVVRRIRSGLTSTNGTGGMGRTGGTGRTGRAASIAAALVLLFHLPSALPALPAQDPPSFRSSIE